MPMASPLDNEAAELVARRFRALADPTRLRILDLLRRREEASVGEITAALGSSQQNVSKHLGALHAAGVLSRRRDGNRVIYAIADESVLEICEVVCGSLERRADELSEMLEAVAS